MSRQIKFRVWNKKTNNWVEGCARNDIASLDGVNLFGETILLGAFMNGVSLEDLEDCEALQFTGLEDKNGKEIFEGDILKDEWKNGFIFLYDVYWLDTTASFELCPIKEYDYPEEYNEPTLSWLNLSKLAVIGNIFENSELLK
jgi:uncharacterized phage protein (TIGR01671 family)